MYVLPYEVAPLSYSQALNALHACLKFGIQPLLETVVDMLENLGNPDKAVRCVQIAGTNGKTSTARYTAAILRGAGIKTALYTSPELVAYPERMEIDGVVVSEQTFAHGISAALEAGRRVNQERQAQGLRPYDVTEFDTLTVAAFVIFAEAEVETVVLECGMGGRWDATSAAASITDVAITGIGLDHMRILGDTKSAIAGEKAAIIQPSRSCVLGMGCLDPEVMPVMEAACKEANVKPQIVSQSSFTITRVPNRLGAPLELTVQTARATYPELAALKPRYQAANIACAVTLAENHLAHVDYLEHLDHLDQDHLEHLDHLDQDHLDQSGKYLDYNKLYDAILTCQTPGRFQLLRPDPLVLIDACHNPQSVEKFLASLDDIEPTVTQRPTLLLAALKDKDVVGMLRLLANAFPKVVVTETASSRAMPAEELKALAEKEGLMVSAAYTSVAEAVAALDKQAYIACGSITLAGEVAAEFC